MNRFLFYWTCTLLLVASSCTKSRNNDFPNVQVNEVVFLNNPSNQALMNPGGWVYAPGGLKGLIIYRRYVNNNAQDFAAYDRACPVHFDESCGLLRVSDDDIYAECGCENDRYVLFDGSPSDNAQRSLVQYFISYDGARLIISN